MMSVFRITVSMLLIAFASTSFAQATRTWVSGVGDDANPCSRTAPCKTFAGAISKTAAGGKINVLDPGGYGAVTITKSIMIEAEGSPAGVLASGTNAIIISASATDTIALRNLKLEGIGTGLTGIRILAAGSVLIDHVVIEDFGNHAISIENSANSTHVLVNEAVLRRAGSLSTDALINVAPTGTGTATLTVRDSTLLASRNAIQVQGAAKFSVRNSVLSGGSDHGLSVLQSVSTTTGWLDNVQISDFGGAGVAVAGANSSVRVGNSLLSNNSTGLISSASGQIISFGDNRVSGNLANGVFTGSESKQ